MMKPGLFLGAAAAALLCAACPAKDPTIGSLCMPGAQQCTENIYQRCADDGARWVTIEDCAPTEQICVIDKGCLNCIPDNITCGGDGFDIVRCRTDGSAEDTLGRCDPEIGELCNGGSCKNACEYAEMTRSYEGCDYWAVDLDNAVVSDQGAAAAQQYSIVVTNPLELPATVTVTVNDAPVGQPPIERVVEEVHLARIPGFGDLQIIDLDAREVDCTSDPQLNDGTGSCLSSQAFHVHSTAPIVAYQFNPLENVGVFSNDASLLLPTTAVDKTYLVMGWPQTLAITENPSTNGTIDLRAFLTIVGTEADTEVTVQLGPDTQSILSAPGIPAAAAGDLLTFNVGPYDVINLETDGFNADFTSTLVQANKNVMVFSGGEASDVPFFDSWLQRDCCADHLEEQLFPISSFGNQFVAVKTPLRTKYVEMGGWDVAVVPDEPEYWRILAYTEDTNVNTNLPPPNDHFYLGTGQHVTFKTERDFVVSASKPVSFAQLPGSQQTTGIPPVTGGGQRPPGGDPSLIMVPPIQQWREKYVFLVPNKYAFDFLLMAVPTDTRVLYDGVLLETANPRCEYEPIGVLSDGTDDVEYQAIRCPLSDPFVDDPNNPALQDDGRHVIESDNGERIGLIVWGWDSYVSYGYPAGTNLDLINPG
jgi:hypothetical protein